jgi:hypothetical protein
MEKLKDSMELKCSVIHDVQGPHLKFIIPIGKLSAKQAKKKLIELRKSYNEEITIDTSINWNIMI